MPIWFELATLMLLAYGVGLVIGWLIWGRVDANEAYADRIRSEQED